MKDCHYLRRIVFLVPHPKIRRTQFGNWELNLMASGCKQFFDMHFSIWVSLMHIFWKCTIFSHDIKIYTIWHFLFVPGNGIRWNHNWKSRFFPSTISWFDLMNLISNWWSMIQLRSIWFTKRLTYCVHGFSFFRWGYWPIIGKNSSEGFLLPRTPCYQSQTRIIWKRMSNVFKRLIRIWHLIKSPVIFHY